MGVWYYLYMAYGKLYNMDKTDKPPDRNNWVIKFHMALPHWKKWSRTLRRVFLLLPSHGADNDGIRDIADELGKDYDGLIKLINKTKTFRDQLEYYRETGVLREMRSGKPFAFYVGVHDVANMVARESAALALIQIDISRGKAPAQALQIASRSGYLDHVNPKKAGFVENGRKVEGNGTKPEVAPESGLTDFHEENAATV